MADTCGDRVRVSVQDEGPGIPADSLDKLFQKFNQIQANCQKDKGTGLGLAISKAIIAHHKGDIGVSSAPGGGATFWLELPLNDMVYAS
ncbi:MAG: ATP-binding protein [Candidatus Obscuribacterales bacterium]|nr:ATP-binding protein [Candidatus Obscuribacterales bacterium]